MSDPVLHIKDSYFFEVPRALCPANFRSRSEFPDVWVKLDEDFQGWEFNRLYKEIATSADFSVFLPEQEKVSAEWREWQHHDEANFGKPFDVFLEEKYASVIAKYDAWRAKETQAAKEAKATPEPESISFKSFVKADKSVESDPYIGFYNFRQSADGKVAWEKMRSAAGDVKAYKTDPAVKEWPANKIEGYNYHLSGKILIPQPFGELRNLHEAESGYCISKFAVIQLAVGLIMCVIFGWLGKKVIAGTAPKGRLWNLLETFVVFIRDEVAEPAIGHHDAHRFVPMLCTIFFFVLGCNLCGMLPWVGSPTGSFSVTLALAAITLLTVTVAGMKQFGFFGFFKNQIPSMDLPLPIAIVLKPMLFAIEILGLGIKHAVLAVRLLANMVAGHLVLLGVMSVAFGAATALQFEHAPGWQWPVAASISVVGCTIFSILELGVAFLQAYIFTFLSALFIGASVHHH